MLNGRCRWFSFVTWPTQRAAVRLERLLKGLYLGYLDDFV